MKKVALALAFMLTAAPAFAQLGGLGQLKKRAEQAQKVADLKITDSEERQIGEEVSQKIRTEFGVFQDAAVTKYVGLVGMVLAQASSRPDLKWEFIVLDTDGVNAFAAPGGIVHITRGALGLIKGEAELAGVLGHEISHVTRKHTVNAIMKSGAVKAGTAQVAGDRALLNRLANATYDNIVENGFDRGDEEDADREGVRLVNKAKYNPSGLSVFLGKLMERNKGNDSRNALFASHPETQARIDKIGAQIKSEKLTATGTADARYKSTITFDAKPITSISSTSASGAKGVAESAPPKDDKDAKKEEPKKKKGFGLGSLKELSSGKQVESTQASASAGGRAVGKPDREAKGGSNPAPVRVTISGADLDAFRKGIS